MQGANGNFQNSLTLMACENARNSASVICIASSSLILSNWRARKALSLLFFRQALTMPLKSLLNPIEITRARTVPIPSVLRMTSSQSSLPVRALASMNPPAKYVREVVSLTKISSLSSSPLWYGPQIKLMSHPTPVTPTANHAEAPESTRIASVPFSTMRNNFHHQYVSSNDPMRPLMTAALYLCVDVQSSCTFLSSPVLTSMTRSCAAFFCTSSRLAS
mmetsp:Transcript_14016/g.28658  ORF Transcript_14016/g.28658 Transcript_14016/m.28658 type:complete len:219 (+) Transcript_14016:131-787(+)